MSPEPRCNRNLKATLRFEFTELLLESIRKGLVEIALDCVSCNNFLELNVQARKYPEKIKMEAPDRVSHSPCFRIAGSIGHSML